MSDNSSYLKDELYEKVKTDSEVFNFLQDGSLDGIWYWDIEKPLNEWLSPRFKDLFGYRDEEIPNTSEWWQKNINPAHLKLVMDNFEEHCKNPNHRYDQIVCYRHKDGSDVWVRCRGLAIRDENGKPVRMLGAHTDVTELIKTQNELVKTMKSIQILNDKIREFVAIVSHDLRAPIGNILSLIEVLEDDLTTNNVKEVLPTIREVSEHSLEMVNKLLDLTSIESGKVKLRFEKIYLDELIKGAIKHVKVVARNKGIKINVKIQENTEVEVDVFRMRQALINLITNSIKFSNPGSFINIDCSRKKKEVQISVIDFGIGIPEKIMDSLFDKSKHVSREGTNHEKGTGYGLPLVLEILQAHGAKIRVKSKEGLGSTFYFNLDCK